MLETPPTIELTPVSMIETERPETGLLWTMYAYGEQPVTVQTNTNNKDSARPRFHQQNIVPPILAFLLLATTSARPGSYRLECICGC
jgi:hypothetical protein